MGLIKDRHGTYSARHKVPERLQAAVAGILDNGKARQVWLKKSLGTKVVAQANVRAKPVQMEFDRIIARAEAQLKERPVRTSLTDIEIKRIADFFYAHEVAGDEELRMDGRGDDPMYVSIHKQLTGAVIEFDAPYDLKALTLEPGQGLSKRMMERIEEAGDASRQRHPGRKRGAIPASWRRVCTGLAGSGLHRGSERRDRISLCGQSAGSLGSARDRFGSAAGGRDRGEQPVSARRQAATTMIPIVFATGADPVKEGLVDSLNRPGGNVTGVSFLGGLVGAKRLELLRQVVPKVTTVAMLMQPNRTETELERKDVQDAARAIGLQLITLDVSSDRDIETAFATLVKDGAGALLVGTGAYLASKQEV
jgi:hypothetical protein